MDQPINLDDIQKAMDNIKSRPPIKPYQYIVSFNTLREMMDFKGTDEEWETYIDTLEDVIDGSAH